jgi:hypothetical protein
MACENDLWLSLESITLIPLSKGLERGLGVGALLRCRQEMLLEVRIVQDAPPPARPLIDALPQLLEPGALGMVQPASDVAVPWLCVDVVAGERSFPARA